MSPIMKHHFITEHFNVKKRFHVSIFGHLFDIVVIDLGGVKYLCISNVVSIVIFVLFITYSSLGSCYDSFIIKNSCIM